MSTTRKLSRLAAIPVSAGPVRARVAGPYALRNAKLAPGLSASGSLASVGNLLSTEEHACGGVKPAGQVRSRAVRTPKFVALPLEQMRRARRLLETSR